ncbi:hypothetical protein AAG906_005631 [Vitis piasezkii]
MDIKLECYFHMELSLCSLLKPALEKCQQDYYKYLNKLDHPTTLKHDSMGSLKDDNDSIKANAYVVVVAMENKKKKD